MSVERLAELMQARRPCVVLTGAGISTESGIPDFRSPAGIWAKYDPMEYATIDAFLADPAKVWDFYGKRLALLGSAEPNDGHRALAELEDRGWVRAVITQNIDRLHERAGSRALVEVHGSIRTSSCLDCGAVVPFDEVVELLPVPRARAAGACSSPTSSCSASCCRRPRSRARRSSPRRRGCCSSSARRSRSIPSPGCRSRRSQRGGDARDRQSRRDAVRLARGRRRSTRGAGETLRALADALPERP